MKKRLFALIAILISTNALAEWTRVGATEDSDIYLDLNTIHRKGNKVKIWELTNYKDGSSDGRTYLSQKVQTEFDCEERVSRTLTAIWFSRNMGNGQVTDSLYDPSLKWRPIAPESVGGLLWEIACDEKSGKTRWIALSQLPKEASDEITGYDYIDRDTITRKGDFARMWQLTDFRSSSQSDNFSVKTRVEYDCKQTRMRILTVMFFSANMGIGKANSIKDDIQEWSSIVRGSFNETLWNKACNKPARGEYVSEQGV